MLSTSVSQSRRHQLRRNRAVGSRVAAEDDSCAPLHQVKRGSENALVLAVEDRRRRGRIDMAEPREDAVLASHVVGRLDPIAKGRPAQDPFLVARADQVGQVRMPCGNCSTSSGPSAAGKWVAR